MSSEEEDFMFLADDIQEKRHLPYSVIVEKVEGDIIYTHNQWGNDVRYLKGKDVYELLTDADTEEK
ncbi:MAG: hypothetical protein ACTSWW_04600 [Promethearchaeota archaeon]